MMKKTFSIFLIFLFGIYFSLAACNSEGKSPTSSDTNGGTINPPPKEIEKVKVEKGIKIPAGAVPIDDGRWVAIIDDMPIMKAEFESIYKLLVKMMGVLEGTGSGAIKLAQQRQENKKNMLERIIMIRLAFSKASEDKFYQTPEGKTLLKTFSKQAYMQYFVYKEAILKVKEPSEKDLKEHFKKVIKPKYPKFTIDTEQNIRKVKMDYMRRKIAMQQGMLLKKLNDESVTVKNKKMPNLIEQYLDKKITKEMLQNDKEGKYWILKIKNKPVLLKDIAPLIDTQLQAAIKAKKTIKPKLVGPQLFNSAKMMELAYRAAIKKNYHKDQEGKEFANFLVKRQVANQFLIQTVLAKVKDPTEKQIQKVFDSKPGKDEATRYLKSKKIPVTDENIKKYIKQKLHTSQLMMTQKQFVEDLRGAHKIIKSKKYFETESDKIQKKSKKEKDK